MIEVEVVDLQTEGIRITPESVRRNVTMQATRLGVKYPIYVEIWNRDAYHGYFTTHPRSVRNPLTHDDHLLRGWCDFTGERHEICLIYGADVYHAIIHEMIHCRQAEKVGVTLWKQLTDIYKDDRENDPFEIEAYLREGER